MSSLNDSVREYKIQLSKGQIQKAYKGIMNFMADLKAYLEGEHTDFTAGSLYFGYMDMTYFAFTPSTLKNKKLKVAIVFLHEECKFELWLAGNNRQLQADYIALLSHKDLGGFSLSQIHPGVDSILTSSMIPLPDFDHPDKLKKQIEVTTLKFANDIIALLN